MNILAAKRKLLIFITMSNPASKPQSVPPHGLAIRPLREEDLATADRQFRLAFGTFVGLPEPAKFAEGREYVRARWRVNPAGALAAECAGELIGSNQVSAWGSVGFFGPLVVRPDYWDRGVGKRLLEATMPLFEGRGIRHLGLFTFPHSAKHVGLYHKFGFSPRFLTAIMTKAVAANGSGREVQRFSTLSASKQAEALRGCREISESLFEGLSLEEEIGAVHQQRWGETLLWWEGSRLEGFAVCHFGHGSEGGANCCYVKFAAARPGPKAGEGFERLLGACEGLAAAQGLPEVEAGVSLARDDAYRRMLARGFRTKVQGVAMHKPNEPGYHRAGFYVIDDWR